MSMARSLLVWRDFYWYGVIFIDFGSTLGPGARAQDLGAQTRDPTLGPGPWGPDQGRDLGAQDLGAWTRDPTLSPGP